MEDLKLLTNLCLPICIYVHTTEERQHCSCFNNLIFEKTINRSYHRKDITSNILIRIDKIETQNRTSAPMS